MTSTSASPSRRHVLRGAVGLAGLAVGARVLTPAAVAVGGASTSVRDHGAVGDGRADDTAALQRAMAHGAPTVVVGRGVYLLSASLEVPWHVRRLVLEDGAVLRQTADVDAVHRGGVVDEQPVALAASSPGEHLLRPLGGGSAGLAVGDWLYHHSADFFDRDRYRPGALRRVVALHPDGVEVDRPAHRAMTSGHVLHRVRLAPSVRLEGPGAVEHADPASTRRTLVRLDLVADPEVDGVELRQGGHAGLLLWATAGGRVDVDVHDLLDDAKGGHYGYGVEVRSATRDLVVRGRARRVRHAFTTNGGWTPPLFALMRSGEPEHVHVQMEVRDTSSTGLDTHEAGHHLTLVPDVVNAGTERWGGVNVRSADTLVDGGHVVGSGQFGVLVQAFAERCVVRGTRVEDSRGPRALDLQGQVHLEGVQVSGAGLVGVFAEGSSDVTARDLSVTGTPLGVVVRDGGGWLHGTVRSCDQGVVAQRDRAPDTSALHVVGCDRPSGGGAAFSTVALPAPAAPGWVAGSGASPAAGVADGAARQPFDDVARREPADGAAAGAGATPSPSPSAPPSAAPTPSPSPSSSPSRTSAPTPPRPSASASASAPPPEPRTVSPSPSRSTPSTSRTAAPDARTRVRRPRAPRRPRQPWFGRGKLSRQL